MPRRRRGRSATCQPLFATPTTTFTKATVNFYASLSPSYQAHAPNGPLPAKQVISKMDGLRDKAMRLAALLGGECLSKEKLSIVKGQEAFKFRCLNGHIFYRFVSELESLAPRLTRRLSKTTAVSSSSSVGHSSDEEMPCASDKSNSSKHFGLEGCWCPRCENFYRQC